MHGGAALAMDPVPAPRMLPVRHGAVPRAEASAWKLLLGPLPAALVPTEKHRVLQAALVWDQLLGVQHLADSEPLTVGEDEEAATFQVCPITGRGRRSSSPGSRAPLVRVTGAEGAELGPLFYAACTRRHRRDP